MKRDENNGGGGGRKRGVNVDAPRHAALIHITTHRVFAMNGKSFSKYSPVKSGGGVRIRTAS